MTRRLDCQAGCWSTFIVYRSRRAVCQPYHDRPHLNRDFRRTPNTRDTAHCAAHACPPIPATEGRGSRGRIVALDGAGIVLPLSSRCIPALFAGRTRAVTDHEATTDDVGCEISTIRRTVVLDEVLGSGCQQGTSRALPTRPPGLRIRQELRPSTIPQ